MTVAGMEKVKKQALLWRYIRQVRAGYFLWIGIWADTDQLLCRPGDLEHGLWFLRKTRLIRAPKRCLAGLLMESRRPPYGILLAAICNPVGRHMQSRRLPYAIPPAAICNPAGRQVPAGMNNRLSDDECWMLQYGDLHPHSSPNGREDLILSS